MHRRDYTCRCVCIGNQRVLRCALLYTCMASEQSGERDCCCCGAGACGGARARQRARRLLGPIAARKRTADACGGPPPSTEAAPRRARKHQGLNQLAFYIFRRTNTHTNVSRNILPFISLFACVFFFSCLSANGYKCVRCSFFTLARLMRGCKSAN
jgi:hypothetical protein